MRRSQPETPASVKPTWANTVSNLRASLKLSQTAFGQRLHSSAMAISRWERGVQEPPAGSYIELGNIAGDPLCWFFWGRAGLRTEDVMRVLRRRRAARPPYMIELQIATAGASSKKLNTPQLVAIPLLKVSAGTQGEKGDSMLELHEAPVESVIAAPSDWCPNPTSTTCLRVKGDSMKPLIYDGYILAVDSSQNDRTLLHNKVVIAWHKDKGLTVSRLQRYDHTQVLQPENRDYDSIVMDRKNDWKILAKVLWWIGKAP